MRRISFITESSARPAEAMPAYQYYQGKQSRWINAVIEYMEVRSFPREDIFFLSPYGQRIIGYEEIVDPYPLQKNHPRKSDALKLADKVMKLIRSLHTVPFVEIHAGRTLADPLKASLDAAGISYRVYADGVLLGTKPNAYQELIAEEQTKRKHRGIQREKWQITSLVQYQTPSEASELVYHYGKRAQQFGIEANIEELKGMLAGYRRKQKDEAMALQQFENLLTQEDANRELECFLQSKASLAALHADEQFESMKNKYGKSMAKFSTYLIKHTYVLLLENRINEAMLRTQIALMK